MKLDLEKLEPRWPALGVLMLPALLATAWLVYNASWFWTHNPDLNFGWIVVVLAGFLAPVRLFGFVSEKAHGVTYDQLGINGAQANIIDGWDASIWVPQLARRSPGLIVLAYGTNDAGNRDYTHESYKAMFAGVLAKLRQAVPTASILVLGPPDRMYRMSPFPRLEMIAQAQREAALEHGCAFWDLRERMGGAGAMRRWVVAGAAQGDYVHFTAAGYRLIGATLFNDLMEQYATYLRVRDRVFTATENGKTAENSQNRTDGGQAARLP